MSQFVVSRPAIRSWLPSSTMGNRLPAWGAGHAHTEHFKPTFYEYEINDLDGHKMTMAAYKNAKALLVFNVSSKCGLTKGYYPQMAELRAKLRQEFPDSNFEILGFSCGQFANQEYDSSAEIKAFLKDKHPEVNFPVFEKIEVNGKNTHPIFQWLKYQEPTMCDRSKSPPTLKPVGWNFGKFLLDGSGRVVKYYGPKVEPKNLEADCRKVIQGELKGHEIQLPKGASGLQNEDANLEGQSCARIIAEQKAESAAQES